MNLCQTNFLLTKKRFCAYQPKFRNDIECNECTLTENKKVESESLLCVGGTIVELSKLNRL